MFLLLPIIYNNLLSAANIITVSWARIQQRGKRWRICQALMKYLLPCKNVPRRNSSEPESNKYLRTSVSRFQAFQRFIDMVDLYIKIFFYFSLFYLMQKILRNPYYLMNTNINNNKCNVSCFIQNEIHCFSCYPTIIMI